MSAGNYWVWSENHYVPRLVKAVTESEAALEYAEGEGFDLGETIFTAPSNQVTEWTLKAKAVKNSAQVSRA